MKVRSSVGYIDVAVPENEAVVCRLSDLPEPVSGVITLPPSTLWRFCGPVDIGPNRLVLSLNSTLRGGASTTDSITSSSGADLITSAVGCAVHDLTLTCPGGNIFNIDGAGVRNSVCTGVTCANASAIGTFANLNAAFFQLFSGAFIQNGVTFDGTIASVVMSLFSFALLPSANADRCCVLPATLTASAVELDLGGIIVDGAAQVGLSVAGGATLDKLTLTRTRFTTLNGAAETDPAYTSLKTEPRISCFDNPLLPNSAVRGGVAFTGNAGGVVTDIVTVDVFVPIGNGNPGTHPVYVLDANSERTSLQGVTAPTQELRYTGKETFHGEVTISLSIETPSRAAGAIFSARLLLNGSPVANSEFQSITGGRTNAAGSLSYSVPLELNEDDDLQVEIANNDDNSDLIVVACRLSLS
jgi:hypothetical protein